MGPGQTGPGLIDSQMTLLPGLTLLPGGVYYPCPGLLYLLYLLYLLHLLYLLYLLDLLHLLYLLWHDCGPIVPYCGSIHAPWAPWTHRPRAMGPGPSLWAGTLSTKKHPGKNDMSRFVNRRLTTICPAFVN